LTQNFICITQLFFRRLRDSSSQTATNLGLTIFQEWVSPILHHFENRDRHSVNYILHISRENHLRTWRCQLSGSALKHHNSSEPDFLGGVSFNLSADQECAQSQC
jgi:hypothetical protein